jgi:hypothetical protein
MPLDGVFAANHRDTYRNTLENCLWNHHGWRRYFGLLSTMYAIQRRFS